jgi:hypothetical protein
VSLGLGVVTGARRNGPVHKKATRKRPKNLALLSRAGPALVRRLALTGATILADYDHDSS